MSCIILTIPAVGHLASFYFSFKSFINKSIQPARANDRAQGPDPGDAPWERPGSCSGITLTSPLKTPNMFHIGSDMWHSICQHSQPLLRLEGNKKTTWSQLKRQRCLLWLGKMGSLGTEREGRKLHIIKRNIYLKVGNIINVAYSWLIAGICFWC